MNLSSPRVCVLIPVWKDQVGLDRTLESLTGEETPFDIIVVDDGSPEPISCLSRYGIHDVTLERLPRNRGIEHALNEGLAIAFARGYSYVARLDCGDLPHPGRLSRQMEFLETHLDVGMVGTWAQCVNDDGDYLFTMRLPTDHAAIVRKQRYVPGLLHPTVMIRAEALRCIGVYSDRYQTAEDYDLFVRMARTYQLANIPEALTTYIVSESGTTAAKRKLSLVSRLRVQLDNFDWLDPHAHLGVARTLLFLIIPFQWLIALKKRRWR